MIVEQQTVRFKDGTIVIVAQWEHGISAAIVPPAPKPKKGKKD